MDYVYKNDFREVKLREMESGLAKTVVMNSSHSFNIPLAVHIVYSSHREGRSCPYSRQLKLNSEFYKKRELEEISICSFKPIRSTKLKKIVLVLVRSVNFLSDATILFQIKPWEYEDWMKNSDEKVNVGASRDAQKQYLGGEG